MNTDSLVISNGKLQKNLLNGKIVLITGAGGGIGYETVRSLIWLGAKVIIAEINKSKGKRTEAELNQEFGEGNAFFIHTDIGNDRSVRRLVKKTNSTFGTPDVIFNNATVANIGAVHEVGIDKWDLSYRTNLRGPVLLVSYFLPDMIKRNSGVIVFVPSSGAAPYMGAYEVFKTAQVELANTLSAELEETEVITYSIGPGIVKTETAHEAIEKLAPLYGKSVDDFYKMSENVLLTTEEAGAGFAASIVLASQYKGLEIGSIQALMDIGISIGEKKPDYTLGNKIELSEEEKSNVQTLFQNIKNTFIEQVEGWSNRPLFERQWVMRDFKKHMGASPEFFLQSLKEFEKKILVKEIPVDNYKELPLEKIYSYYQHQIDLLKGYERNPVKVREYSDIMNGWLEAINEFKACIDSIQARIINK
jgi:NAD(P)-dependent dehydrogenase (short-subunit alcohol dehydrogenase family)